VNPVLDEEKGNRMTFARRRVLGAVFAAALAGAAMAVHAQGAAHYPNKPIRIVVPFPPGGFNDTLGRQLAQEFQKAWGQPAIVENKPGAGSAIGAEFVAKSPPDGYTLLIVAFPFGLINSLHARLGMDVNRDFAPIAFCALTPNILVVHPSVPANTVGELVALARQKPGTLNYASTGTGSSNHLSMELFKAMTRTDIVHVPYKGSAPAVTDLLAGQVGILFDNTPNVLPQIRAGKLRALGVTTSKRSSFTPELPTVAESGVSGYEVTAWFGVVAPANTPRDIVAKLNAEVNRVLALPETKDRFQNAGVEATGGSPEDFARFIRGEVDKWGKVVRDANIRAD
jgi:tripartite-type tricarboxylate transporter receptor subunit TctC